MDSRKPIYRKLLLKWNCQRDTCTTDRC